MKYAIIITMLFCTSIGETHLYSQDMNLDEITFYKISIPFGDSVSVAYLNDENTEAFIKEVGAKEIRKKFAHPNLSKTYLFKNGWIAYKQFVDDGYLFFKSKDEFWRFKDWNWYLDSGVVFRESKTIRYVTFHLKPAAVKALKVNHQWTEIQSKLDQERLFASKKGSIMELHWPHYNSGRWFPSLKDYDKRIEWTSDD